ncbi:MAG: hypothetical protein LBS10_08555 [Gracilibacteraceae bacterium]|jgi:Tfp pilus assembly protein PilN|nr:hypothetical protein [Gracilibacteraceae bacterium]
MYGVSLLPPEYKSQLQQEKRTRLIVLVAILVAALMLLVFLTTMVFKWRYSMEISALQVEQDQLQTRINALKDEETIVNDLTNTKLNINNLVASASKLSTNIIRIGDALPDEVTVTEIALVYDLQTIAGTLKLQAPDELTLRQCVDRLRLLDGVTSVGWSQLVTTGEGLTPVSCTVTMQLPRVTLN